MNGIGEKYLSKQQIPAENIHIETAHHCCLHERSETERDRERKKTIQTARDWRNNHSTTEKKEEAIPTTKSDPTTVTYRIIAESHKTFRDFIADTYISIVYIANGMHIYDISIYCFIYFFYDFWLYAKDEKGFVFGHIQLGFDVYILALSPALSLSLSLHKVK